MNIEIYTDGSCYQNIGGWAAALYIEGALVETVYGGVIGATNNTMELTGLIEGMRLIPTLEKIYCKNCGMTPYQSSLSNGEIHIKDVALCPEKLDCLKYDKWVAKQPMYVGVPIYSDSEYSIKGASSWIDTWKTNGWRTKAKQPVKNQELWQEIDALRKITQPEFKWVKGHNGHPQNEHVDKLAGIGRMAMIDFLKSGESDGFAWKTKIE